MSRRIARHISPALCAALLGASSFCAGSQAMAAAEMSCEELASVVIATNQISLPTSGASITSAETVDSPMTGEYCQVQGEIEPVDITAPAIKFQVNLPQEWNDRSILFGGSGMDGVLATGTTPLPPMPLMNRWPVAEGFVTYGSDSGHQAGPALGRDGSFMANDEALRNYSGDALKKTHDVAMQLVDARYGKAPIARYVIGGSTGGREALIAVSRWPAEFQGALVFYPAWNLTAQNLHRGVVTQQMAKPGAYPSKAKRTLLYDAAIEACDGLDGLKDGIISNQARCDKTFDPASATVNGKRLRCSPGETNIDSCLTEDELDSFMTMNDPIQFTYTRCDNGSSYPGLTTWGTDFGRTSGSQFEELVTMLTLGMVAPAYPMPPVQDPMSPPHAATFWDEWVRYAVTRDPSFNSLTLDPEEPREWQSRIIELRLLQDVDPTKLAAFEQHGGKILIAHGVHDGTVSNRATQDLVTQVTESLGETRTRNLLRYYEIPGYGHAFSTSFNAEWNALPVLMAWAEQGQAPGPQVIQDIVGPSAGRTRPLCEYPTWPKYTGGDANRASSFTCVEVSDDDGAVAR